MAMYGMMSEGAGRGHHRAGMPFCVWTDHFNKTEDLKKYVTVNLNGAN